MTPCAAPLDQSEPSKIIFVCGISGTFKAFLEPQAKYLKKFGWIVDFACNAERFSSDSINQFHPLAIHRSGSVTAILIAAWQLRKILSEGKYGMIQFCTPVASFVACLALISMPVARRPISIYSQWGIRYVAFSGLKRFFYKRIEHFVCAVANVVQPDSYGNKVFAINERLVPESKIEVVGAGSAVGIELGSLPDRRTAFSGNKLRDELHLPRASIVFGFVGSIRADKGINELLLAFSKLCESVSSDPCPVDVRLLLIGPVCEEDPVDSSLWSSAMLNSHVIHLGYRDDVNRYYAAMDCFVFPSYREGLGMALLEAIGSALPVVATRIPGPSELVIEGVTGWLVESKDVRDLSACLKNVLTKRHLLNDMGCSGRRLIASKYNRSCLLKKFLVNKREILTLHRC